jgi:hypothetical protein
MSAPLLMGACEVVVEAAASGARGRGTERGGCGAKASARGAPGELSAAALATAAAADGAPLVGGRSGGVYGAGGATAGGAATLGWRGAPKARATGKP